MKYEVVPSTITGKDLDYLSDMFNWNYNAFKCTYDSIKNVIFELDSLYYITRTENPSGMQVW